MVCCFTQGGYTDFRILIDLPLADGMAVYHDVRLLGGWKLKFHGCSFRLIQGYQVLLNTIDLKEIEEIGSLRGSSRSFSGMYFLRTNG